MNVAGNLRSVEDVTFHRAPESGAEATAVQTLRRRPCVREPCEASGLRRVHRRFSDEDDLNHA